jgi:hypothetical protein
VEADFNLTTKGEEFSLIEQMKKEAGAQKEDCPATKSAFNEIKDFQTNDCSNRGGEKTGILNGDKGPGRGSVRLVFLRYGSLLGSRPGQQAICSRKAKVARAKGDSEAPGGGGKWV